MPNIDIPILGFVFNILISALLAIILKFTYIRYGNSLSNRRQFGNNFLLITMTTVLIITVVKSSLALSLGLVGALSIIRFRAAIKDPEELAYIFLTIAVGLGLGADQRTITIIAFATIIIIVAVTKKISNPLGEDKNLNLSIQSNNLQNLNLKAITNILKINCDAVELRRFDQDEESLEISFIIEIKEISFLDNIKKGFQELDKKVKITFLDNKGLI